MAQIKVTIDGKECLAQEGETLLNIARANGIFIPALCYLDRCSPTLACRICLVEADGKQVYSCNAKAKDGMVVQTTTENIKKERRAIMEVYDVNHPLQCGVCDQSGECELQNYTLYEEVDSQSYAIRDVDRQTKDWGHIQYDPALCIVCEKCVTVCKDMVGDTALKTVPRGSEKLPAEFKEQMPKDAYAMWNKLNKSIIGTVTGETLDCSSCGECSAVCPVGALVSTDYKYTTNSWELEKIPSTCAHCSVGCQIYYEVKHTDIENSDKKIYRVTNEPHYQTLCGAGRYGYDFENHKTDGDISEAVEKLSKADTIIFNSKITNEEAYILQQISEKTGAKLYNPDAKNYQRFLEAFSKVSGKSLYSGDLKGIRSCNFVVSIGSFLRSDSPNSRYALNNSMKVNKGAGLYFHPIVDTIVNGMGKNLISIQNSLYSEDLALAFLLKKFGKELPENVESYINSLDFAPLNLPEDFDASLEKALKKKDKFGLMVGADLYSSPNWKNLAQLVGLVEKYTDFQVVIIPSDTNSLGVAQICKLSDEVSGKRVGYNEKGDYTISALGDGDFSVPALNQQEGTFVNIDKRVVPLNVALEFDGYCLNDIANRVLEKNVENTIDYTKELFEKVDFDALPNHFTNGGKEERGYILNYDVVETEEVTFEEKKEKSIQETPIYLANPVLQFSPFTKKAHQLKESGKIYLSPDLASKIGVKNGGLLKVKSGKEELKISAEVDDKIGGEIAYLPTFDKNFNTQKLFVNYRFAEAKISKV